MQWTKLDISLPVLKGPIEGAITAEAFRLHIAAPFPKPEYAVIGVNVRLANGEPVIVLSVVEKHKPGAEHYTIRAKDLVLPILNNLDKFPEIQKSRIMQI